MCRGFVKAADDTVREPALDFDRFGNFFDAYGSYLKYLTSMPQPRSVISNDRRTGELAVTHSGKEATHGVHGE
ncbi:protein of unknown function [Methylocaldum szegediense]|uniref:Uncharacterized protein n=1 Tax=Methylocaldum szegediense TaxID=73780 RepID=A0ABM9I0N9_9GAMM|nr:protein of unknown function [Methylocaldum szegediense]